MNSKPSYVLVTPARNEAELITRTLDSVVAQTARPLHWVIVSDGSTDGTDDIVARYAKKHDWIELVRAPERSERHFAGKVRAFNLGYEKVKNMPFDYIASLDADLSFSPDYFEFLLSKADSDPKFGVVGTPFSDERGKTYDYRFVSIEHVSGACQLFRRACFEDIGGYTPVRLGGIDHIAVLTARMRGWRTQSFPERSCVHHRKMGTAERSELAARFRFGIQDYTLGSHPFWQLCRSVYQMTKRPWIIGGALLATGYLWAWATRVDRSVSSELADFRRREQMSRLRRFFRIAPRPQP